VRILCKPAYTAVSKRPYKGAEIGITGLQALFFYNNTRTYTLNQNNTHTYTDTWSKISYYIIHSEILYVRAYIVGQSDSF